MELYRKWQPVYNAGAFDGFAKQGFTLNNVNFNPSTQSVDIGSISTNIANSVLPTGTANTNTNTNTTFNSRTYYKQNCATCHGSIGQGGTSESIGGARAILSIKKI